MTQHEFAELKQRVCAAARGYTAMSKFMFAPIVICLVVGMVVGFAIPALNGINVAIILLGVVCVLLAKSRMVAANDAADAAVRAVLQEFNHHLGGRCTVTLYTANTGMCKSRYSAILRVIYVTGAAQNVQIPMAMAMPQQSGAPVVYPAQYGYQHVGGAGPPAMGTPVMGGAPAMGQLQPAGTYSPGYAYPAASNPDLTYTAASLPPAGYYPSPPAAAPSPVAIQREVFYATVPEGVSAGEEFPARTPAGRAVMLTAPTGARGGMDFQVSA